jgi:hypothetical protein
LCYILSELYFLCKQYNVHHISLELFSFYGYSLTIVITWDVYQIFYITIFQIISYSFINIINCYEYFKFYNWKMHHQKDLKTHWGCTSGYKCKAQQNQPTLRIFHNLTLILRNLTKNQVYLYALKSCTKNIWTSSNIWTLYF